MNWCDFHEKRGWASDYCLKKNDYVGSDTARQFCQYGGKDCPIKEQRSSGGCYLTTACVDYKGLSDDCIELTTLRGFRDDYMAETEKGKEDISEYYRTAPAIVESINKSGQANEVYEQLYSDVIVPCVELIQDGKNEEAYEKYRDMVKSLEKQYF